MTLGSRSQPQSSASYASSQQMLSRTFSVSSSGAAPIYGAKWADHARLKGMRGMHAAESLNSGSSIAPVGSAA